MFIMGTDHTDLLTGLVLKVLGQDFPRNEVKQPVRRRDTYQYYGRSSTLLSLLLPHSNFACLLDPPRRASHRVYVVVCSVSAAVTGVRWSAGVRRP